EGLHPTYCSKLRSMHGAAAPEQIASVIASAGSSHADYLTGADLRVDGGAHPRTPPTHPTPAPQEGPPWHAPSPSAARRPASARRSPECCATRATPSSGSTCATPTCAPT